MASSTIPDDITSEDQAKRSKPGSSNGDNDETSSIEALNWSDFEDDLIEDDSKLIQSIRSQFSDDSEKSQGNVETPNLSCKQDETIRDTINSDALNDQGIASTNEEIGLNRNFDNLTLAKLSISAISSTLSVASDVNSVDSVSNAPVLDDGPIWAKGSKLYKFEENRRFNQKLTFCVLFTVVLAVGLGVGNLAAYNECEAEHKNMEEKFSPGARTFPEFDPNGRSGLPLPTIISTGPKLKQPETTVKVDKVIEPEPIKLNEPMIDPKYASQADELSRVLKMLDELSRKIDRFENTTRQLGGIVMVSEEDNFRPDTPPRTSKFLGLLDEIMKNKGKKQRRVVKESVPQEQSWRIKKEQVLDDIAEAVLGLMDDVGEEHFKESAEVKLEEDRIYTTRTTYKNVEKEGDTAAEKVSKSKSKVVVTEDLIKDKNTISGNRNKRGLGKDHQNLNKNPEQISEKESYVKPKSKEKKRDSSENRSDKRKSSHHKKDGNRQTKTHKPDDTKRSEKKQKEKQKESEIKSKTKDWQMKRAQYREESRTQFGKTKSNNKKAKNWQLERDNIRERLRDTKYFR